LGSPQGEDRDETVSFACNDTFDSACEIFLAFLSVSMGKERERQTDR
jgi:hypothetical protein